MASFPQILVLDSQPRFGLTQPDFKTSITFLKLADFHENCCKMFSFRKSFLSSTCKNYNPIPLRSSQVQSEPVPPSKPKLETNNTNRRKDTKSCYNYCIEILLSGSDN